MPSKPSVTEILERARTGAASAGRVFGEPIERDGVTVVPVAVVHGGGGIVHTRRGGLGGLEVRADPRIDHVFVLVTGRQAERREGQDASHSVSGHGCSSM